MAAVKSRPGLVSIIGAVALLVLAGLAYVGSANRVLQLGYEISTLQTEQKRALDLNAKLRVELTHLRRPERIEAVARSRLGLVRPDPERVVVLR